MVDAVVDVVVFRVNGAAESRGQMVGMMEGDGQEVQLSTPRSHTIMKITN